MMGVDWSLLMTWMPPPPPPSIPSARLGGEALSAVLSAFAKVSNVLQAERERACAESPASRRSALAETSFGKTAQREKDS